MKHTEIRKKDIAALSHTALVDLLWGIAKSVDESASTFGSGTDEPRENCVVTPGEILDAIEEKALPDRFAWATKKASGKAKSA